MAMPCLFVMLLFAVAPGHVLADEPKDKQANANDAAQGDLTAMTFNIRFNNLGDGKNAWPLRKNDVAELIRREQPDLLGLQEALVGQIADLKERLPDYEWYGLGRDDGKEKGEFAPVFYRRERFELLAKGTFWLSETPDKVGSKGWDAALPRVASWLRVHDKNSGKSFLFANVHFDHRGEKARVESSKLLRRKLLELAGEEPIVLVGDFNATPDSPPHKALVDVSQPDEADSRIVAAVFRDARGLVEKPLGPDTTWNGFSRAAEGSRIDHVVVDRRWAASSYKVIDDKTKDGRFYSDHFPIVVKLKLTSPDDKPK
jgi:endonuclease/exonuclease/phosphatase family metal-dependent hydrolase